MIAELLILLRNPPLSRNLQLLQCSLSSQHQPINLIKKLMFGFRQIAVKWLIDKIMLNLRPRMHKHRRYLYLYLRVFIPEGIGRIRKVTQFNTIVCSPIPREFFVFIFTFYVFRKLFFTPNNIEIIFYYFLYFISLIREVQSYSYASKINNITIYLANGFIISLN